MGGAAVGMTLAPQSTATVGPVRVAIKMVPALHGGVTLELPPVGRVSFATHRGPILVRARVLSVDASRATQMTRSPAQVLVVRSTVEPILREAAIRAGLLAAGGGLVGSVGAVLLIFRATRSCLHTIAGCCVVLLATAGTAVVTFEPSALEQPQFSGALANAPYLVATTLGALERLQSYRGDLTQLVSGVSSLYSQTFLTGTGTGTGPSSLSTVPTPGALTPASPDSSGVTTILHVSDIHLNPVAFDLMRSLVTRFQVSAVIDTGDITTWGTTMESTTLEQIDALAVPYLFVRGNHDSVQTARAVAARPGAVVLEAGQTAVAAGLRFAGIGDPIFTPDADTTLDSRTGQRLMTQTTANLDAAVREWDTAHPDDPVDVAMVHNPTDLSPLYGDVPLILAGHRHKASVQQQPGTLIMVQATTGGGGLTAAGLNRLSDGKPLPLSATLLHFANQGPRAGQLLAYDDVTVGGFGAATVQLRRTVVPADAGDDDAADGDDPSPQVPLPRAGTSDDPG